LCAISFDGAIKLRIPKFYSRLRRRRAGASWMTMPEATMDEDHGLVFREYDVGPAWQICTVEAKAISQPVKQAAHCQLGARIRPLHFGHICAAFIRREMVHADLITAPRG
jgi:hypothetical protein